MDTTFVLCLCIIVFVIIAFLVVITLHLQYLVGRQKQLEEHVTALGKHAWTLAEEIGKFKSFEKKVYRPLSDALTVFGDTVSDFRDTVDEQIEAIETAEDELTKAASLVKFSAKRLKRCHDLVLVAVGGKLDKTIEEINDGSDDEQTSEGDAAGPGGEDSDPASSDGEDNGSSV